MNVIWLSNNIKHQVSYDFIAILSRCFFSTQKETHKSIFLSLNFIVNRRLNSIAVVRMNYVHQTKLMSDINI